MRIRFLTILTFAALTSGCTDGWKMDYGKPAAQFLQADLATKGQAFVGKKITVKGTVAKVDVSNPKSVWLHLSGGIKCHFGKFKRMAESYKVGEVIYIDGFLKRCEEGDILIDPAIGRDPTAPFSPK